jgi:hypothetical protein
MTDEPRQDSEEEAADDDTEVTSQSEPSEEATVMLDQDFGSDPANRILRGSLKDPTDTRIGTVLTPLDVPSTLDEIAFVDDLGDDDLLDEPMMPVDDARASDVDDDTSECERGADLIDEPTSVDSSPNLVDALSLFDEQDVDDTGIVEEPDDASQDPPSVDSLLQPTVVLDLDEIGDLEEFDDHVEMTEVFDETDTVVESDDIGVPVGGGDTDDVFVILPEQMGDEIPVVETEVFDTEDEEAAAALDAPSGTRMLDDVGFDLDDLSETQFVDEETEVATGEEFASEGPTELVDDEELDQLTSDLDDAVLGDDGEDLGDEFDATHAMDLNDDGVVAAQGAFGGRRLVASLVAATVLGIGGFHLYSMFFTDSERSAEASGPQVVAQVVPVVEDPVPVVDDPLIDTGPDVVATANEAVRTAFRDRVTLALNLGFQVEVSNE